MSQHIGKLKEYVALMTRDYGTNDRLMQAIQADLKELGTQLGNDLVNRGFGMIHAGVDKLALHGMQRLGELLANAGKPRGRK